MFIYIAKIVIIKMLNNCHIELLINNRLKELNFYKAVTKFLMSLFLMDYI